MAVSNMGIKREIVRNSRRTTRAKKEMKLISPKKWKNLL